MAKDSKESAKSSVKKGSAKENTAQKPVAGTTGEASKKSAQSTSRKKGSSTQKAAQSVAAPAADAAGSALPGKGKQRQARAKKLGYVVGIGASAGGVEAFSELFEFLTPSSNMSFILVQHLDPTHQSMLTEILQRRTKMPVEEATQGMTVVPGRVYVIPPNRQMTIKNGTLKLVPREGVGKFNPIDHFLGSLAAELKNLAIGIVLSGTGSDGTQGLRAVKTEGGVTFAQDDTARYQEMPKNAASAGVVDFVLSPRHIAQELARIARYPLIVAEEAEEFPEEEHKAPPREVDDTSAIFRLLRQSSGIDFANYKPNTIRRRISRRMVVAKVEKIADYLELLKKNPAEQEALANDLLINVTNFFRDPEIFDLLRDSVLPDLLKQKPPGVPIRVWIAGCSTGEEAYSLAICLTEAANDNHGRVPIQIFATDISEWAVERARAGVYPDSIVADVSKERLRRFFTRVEGGYQVTKSIRDLCVFARQDLAKDPPFSRIDLISCRNVLIYLSPMLQKKIIPTFHYALNPTGVLVLGSSETIGGFADLFSLMDKKHKVYQKKQAAYRLNHDFEVAGYEEKPGVLPKKSPALGPVPVFDVHREADRIILASYAPASVLINEEMDILQFRGKTSNYIEPVSGTASLNLMKMLREGLLLEVRALVIQAKKENLSAQKPGVIIQVDGKEKRVDLDVVPVRGPDTKKPHFFLVLFKDGTTPVPSEERECKPARNPELRQLEQLRQDLQATREYLQSTLEEKDSMSEEFRAAVEEIQSSNEELQSTNEELETAKEELQSTNEELITVNEELQNRNTELSQVNNDLLNLLNNVSFPVVMLTTDLKIRRFTPLAEKILNLIPSDVGRPLSDLRLSILFPDLETMINDVVDTLAPREQEVQDKDGRWYILRVRPYMTLDKKIDGVVMALLDINDMKQHMVLLHQAHIFAEALVKAVPTPLLVLGPDLKVEVANEAYYHLFGTTAGDAEGKYLYTLGGGWSAPGLRQRIESISHGGPSEEVITERDGLKLGDKPLVLTAKRVLCAEGEERILLAITEKV